MTTFARKRKNQLFRLKNILKPDIKLAKEKLEKLYDGKIKRKRI